MEFNKCPQCGSFFAYSGKICPNCTAKDNTKMQKLEDYLQNYSVPDTISELSADTGIPARDLTRFINQNNKFSNLNNIKTIYNKKTVFKVIKHCFFYQITNLLNFNFI